MTSLRERDPFDVRLARTAPPLLEAFNDAGVLSIADIQVARRLGRLGGVEAPELLLAFALAVRAPRLGHVLVDLATIGATVAVDTEEPIDLDALPWPEPGAWTAALAACPLVAVGDEEDDGGGGAVGGASGARGGAMPLRLVGSALYLDRYWREEREVATELRGRAGQIPEPVDERELSARLERLGSGDLSQRRAVAAAALRPFATVAGGPGTGKTTTVAQIAALVVEQARGAGRPAPLIALAAPTGKAAARLEEQVHQRAALLDTAPEVRAHLAGLRASTLHRLLGWRPGSHSRFRHDRHTRLPHDMVIVDEASMVSLTLMARLLEAVRPDARLVLVGDPDQLASIEAGAVLGDIVRSARPGDGIVRLERVYRFGAGIGAVSAAVRDGDADALVAALGGAPGEVTWIPVDGADPATATAAALAPVHDAATGAGRAVIAAARAGDGRAALDALGAFRLLCAHRRGPHGVSAWAPRVERWLAADIAATGAWSRDYPGRPLLVTANDYDLDLFNGDTGVVIASPAGGLTAAFERRGEIVTVRPTRLRAVDTVHAMTIHKSQGSQFGTAAVVVPPADSRILTRELLYTAVTRARRHLIVVGTEESLRAAVARPAARASGLAGRLRA
ncbi:exodeoxyribonuclease V subunit alpha [Conexibacter arvalis]|uniref:RecBCD enzyme subunit RecD n=1 Tax=Conexibacter arvalis TaxID=912552 RepID=A0A840IGZ9_9ACTN|nr:exodeoxyribonuclease V subunit alpha [Conexibacter arvalis]MBB4663463.1 exodeoxyribonuclease V alpha subunit [Conexibacter arvalis]